MDDFGDRSGAVARDDDGINAGAIGRAHTSAEVVRVLHAIEDEEEEGAVFGEELIEEALVFFQAAASEGAVAVEADAGAAFATGEDHFARLVVVVAFLTGVATLSLVAARSAVGGLGTKGFAAERFRAKRFRAEGFAFFTTGTAIERFRAEGFAFFTAGTAIERFRAGGLTFFTAGTAIEGFRAEGLAFFAASAGKARLGGAF